MIDIAAINAMTIWLCCNPNWGGKYTRIRRLFLSELSKSLTTSHNNRRSQQSRLSYKAKLALQSLGYDVKSHTSASPIQNDRNATTKKRCHLYPPHPGRKVRQVCDICHAHVCNSHAVITRTVICNTCENNLSDD